MKGLIFTEFIEMVESQMGFDLANTIIENAHLPSEGIYTAVGTYPEDEMVSLLQQLNKETGTPIPDLLEAFGEYLFGQFAKSYSYMFEGKNNALDFLETIEHYIHVEVLKLYPDALLPTIQIPEKSDQKMIMVYQSPRKLSNLAVGLMKGCIKHFNNQVTINIQKVEKDGEEVWFELTQQ